VPLEEVIQVLELFVLFWSQLLELIFHFLWDFVLVHCAFVEWQNFFFFGFKTSAQFCCFQDSFTQLEVIFQSLNGISRVVRQFFQSSFFFVSESVHFLFEFLVVSENVLFLFFKSVVSGLALLFVLEDLEFKEVDFRFLCADFSHKFVDFLSHVLVILESFRMFLCSFSCIRGILLMHLLKLCVMFGLLRLKIELKVILFFQIFVLDLLSEALFFCLILLKPSLIFFFDSLNHVVEFF